MQVRRLLWLLVLLRSALAPNLATAADSPFACPITVPPDPPFVPPAPYRPNPSQGTFWYGTNGLWTQLGVKGVWRGLPRHESGYFNKLFLWEQGYDVRKDPQPDIILALRRLDTQVPPVTSRGGTNAHFDGVWTMLTGVRFPTEGCWEVTSYHSGHTLTFTVSVLP